MFNYIIQVIQIFKQIYQDSLEVKIPILLQLNRYFLAYRILYSLGKANHYQIQYDSQKLLNVGDDMGYFYQSKSDLLCNNLYKAQELINIFLKKYPYHANATYLWVEIQQRLNLKENQDDIFFKLEQLLKYSKRRKTWQYLANWVNDAHDFQKFKILLEQYYPNYIKQPLKYDLMCHVSQAANRAQELDWALQFWENQYFLVNKKKEAYQKQHHWNIDIVNNARYTFIEKIKKIKKYHSNKAEEALRDVKRCLESHNILFFLISGTLLGCIREESLLKHDKDIDIGVWDTENINDLAQVFYQYHKGCFYVLPIYSQNILVIRHVNGINIDIFIHYRNTDDYWHSGDKCIWHNTPFELMSYPFLKDNYYIPKNYNLYLTENYGTDWNIPKINFESALDTPNIEIIDGKKFLIFSYKKIIFHITNNTPIPDKYLKIIQHQTFLNTN